MVNINLLPWRDELREERKKSFFVKLIGSVIIAAGFVYLGGEYFNEKVNQQNARNEYIKAESSVLENRVKEINDLKDRKQKLVERMKIIQDLQGNRPVTGRIFEQLVKTLPDGVYFTETQLQGKRLTISGVAESNSLISRLMRNLDDSGWLENSVLDSVVVAKIGGLEQANVFKLAVQQTKPKVAANQEGAGK